VIIAFGRIFDARPGMRVITCSKYEAELLCSGCKTWQHQGNIKNNIGFRLEFVEFDYWYHLRVYKKTGAQRA
jgi:hypothetical protein